MSSSGSTGASKGSQEGINSLADLLSSLDLKTAAGSQSGAKPLDARSAQALAEKLSQLLGEDGGPSTVRRNEKGQVLNEEGLPVIEIAEPADSSRSAAPTPIVPLVTVHIPLATLTEDQKAARKREVNRILDELEREEEEAERKKSEAAQEEDLERRKREKQRALDNMAKALAATNKLPAQTKPPTKVETRPSEISVLPDADQTPEMEVRRQANKKVTFAEDVPADKATQRDPVDVGDVVMGQLRSKELSASLAEQPLKLHVVERLPSSVPSGGAKVEVVEDSDDESDDDVEDSTLFTVQAEDYEHVDVEMDEDGDQDDDEDEDGSEAGDDFDTKMLQSEAAAEYYRKREELRSENGAFVGFGHIAVPADGWDPDDVDSFGSSKGPKKPFTVSRFKSTRVARSLRSASALPPGTSLQDKDLVGLVRQGKLDGSGELVVNEDEDEDDADLGPRGSETIQRLRRGETLENMDVDHPGSSPRLPIPAVAHAQPASQPSLSSSAVDGPSTQPKVSRFKAARHSTATGDSTSNSSYPSTSAEPELVPGARKALAPAVVERSTLPSSALRQSAGVVADLPNSGATPAAPAKVSRFKARRADQ